MKNYVDGSYTLKTVFDDLSENHYSLDNSVNNIYQTVIDLSALNISNLYATKNYGLFIFGSLFLTRSAL